MWTLYVWGWGFAMGVVVGTVAALVVMEVLTRPAVAAPGLDIEVPEMYRRKERAR